MKKTTAIIAGLAVSASLIPASAAFAATTSYSVTKAGIAKPGGTFNARLMIEVPSGSLTEAEDKFRLRLPTKSKVDGSIKFTAPKYEGKDNLFVAPTDAEVSAIKEGEEYEVTVKKNAAGEGNKGILYVDFNEIRIPSGHNGDYKANIEAEPGSIFADGAVTLATVGTGSVKISIDDVKSGSDYIDIEKLRIKEDRPGALKVATDSVKFKLPQGFKWDLSDAEVNSIWTNTEADGGDNVTLADDDRTLKFNVNAESDANAAYFEISNLKVKVDESLAKKGEVKVSIGGKSSVSPSEAVIANYGDFSVSAEAFGDTPTRIAGVHDEEMGKILVKESLPGSLIGGRTITLTLPENTRWNTVQDADGKWEILNAPQVSSSESDMNGLSFDENGWTVVDSDARTIKIRIGEQSTGDPAKIVLEKGEISIGPKFSGDLNVEIGGTAVGGTATVKLATVLAPVKLEAASVPEVKIGLDAQTAGDFTIVETAAENLKNDKYIFLELPDGVAFSATPKFEVVEGDVSLETTSATTADKEQSNQIAKVKVRATSAKPAKIKVSNVKLKVNRAVPEGDLIVKINGWDTAYNEFQAHEKKITSGTDKGELRKFAASTVSSVAIAKVVTPHPEDIVKNATFKIGDTKYTVANTEKTADVAPYIKDDRTYMPVRYVAEALGVPSSNIIWDGEAQKVTLIKGAIAVQLTIGSKVLTVNGAAITMDAAPEVVEPGRIMLPIKWVVNAFGGETSYDAATQTVTVK